VVPLPEVRNRVDRMVRHRPEARCLMGMDRPMDPDHRDKVVLPVDSADQDAVRVVPVADRVAAVLEDSSAPIASASIIPPSKARN
jgi:hypothetical protein